MNLLLDEPVPNRWLLSSFSAEDFSTKRKSKIQSHYPFMLD